MDDYLGWLTSGLIFLWILGAQDARAAPEELSADPAWRSNASIRAVNACALRERGNAASPCAGNESRH